MLMRLAHAGRVRVLAALAAVLLVLVALAATVTPTMALADPPVLDCWSTVAAGTCGYPNLTNTGPTGELDPYNGIIETSAANQVIEDLDIHGCIVVRHTGVVINNVKIHGDCFYGVDMNSSYMGSATITDTEIDCEDGQDTGIGDGGNWSALRVYVHDCENGVDMGDNSSLTDSLIRNRETNDSGHSDGVQSGGGTNITIDHNTFAQWNPTTSAMIFDDDGNDYVTVTDNLIRGGAYSLYCPSDALHTVVTGNRFYLAGEPHQFDAYSPFGYTDMCDTAATWSGNIVDSTGDTVNADGTTS